MPLENSPRSRKPIPEGVWTKCDKCEQIIYNKELEENLKVCPKCKAHFRLSARERIAQLFDPWQGRSMPQERTKIDGRNATELP